VLGGGGGTVVFEFPVLLQLEKKIADTNAKPNFLFIRQRVSH